ncbi:MAG TPA: phosphate ABC transporter permease PstA [Acetobacteraceae bacterium]|nr:phosphate ABC transporter permease PstA [Acetobacteraceae bacterium]
MSATTTGFVLPARDDAARLARLARRRAGAITGWVLCAIAFGLLGIAMGWILLMVLIRGVSALTPTVFTEVTQGTGGGLLNAIEGTIVIGVGSMLLAVPFGVAAGLYTAQFSHTVFARVIRFLADVLVGVPSIVLGYFGYITMVEWLGWNFSLAAACITIAILCLPYICRTTELALGQVPAAMQEAAYALGAGEARVAWRISLPMAMPGILTGILLAFAISIGETAPLLYTAGWSSYLWTGQLIHSPVGYLTYAIWAFINEPFAAANALAYAAAFLVTFLVLLISVGARLVLLRRQGGGR